MFRCKEFVPRRDKTAFEEENSISTNAHQGASTMPKSCLVLEISVLRRIDATDLSKFLEQYKNVDLNEFLSP